MARIFITYNRASSEAVEALPAICMRQVTRYGSTVRLVADSSGGMKSSRTFGKATC